MPQRQAPSLCIALVSLLSLAKERHLLRKVVLGAFVWTFVCFKYKLWFYIWLRGRDRNTGLWHSTSTCSLWRSEGTGVMVTPEHEAPLDITGVGHQIYCFDSVITFMKSHFRERDIHIVHVYGKMGCTLGLTCRARRHTGSSSLPA